MASEPAPAAHRDAASEQAAARVQKHRRRHSDWLVAFLFGNMYRQQVNAGDAVYDLAVEHSRRMASEFNERRVQPSSVEGASAAAPVRSSPKKVAAVSKKPKRSLGDVARPHAVKRQALSKIIDSIGTAAVDMPTTKQKKSLDSAVSPTVKPKKSLAPAVTSTTKQKKSLGSTPTPAVKPKKSLGGISSSGSAVTKKTLGNGAPPARKKKSLG
jgi:hypothetical protein